MKISYLIGLPFGLISILFVFWMSTLFIGDSLFSVLIYGIYGKAFYGLVCSFLFALGIGGYFATKSVKKREPILESSFRYSLLVNAIIWSVFLITSIFNNENYLFPIAISLLAFILCTTFTTFTIGLLICFFIKRNISN